MLISMTGFGRAMREGSLGRFVAEIQAVNRKYLEMNISLPKDLQRYELDIRKQISEVVSRGQINLRVFLTASEMALSALLPDPIALKRQRDAWLAIARKAGCDEKDVDLPFLLSKLPSVADVPANEEQQVLLLKECVDEALRALISMKGKEGHALTLDISGRIDAIEGMVQSIQRAAPDCVVKIRQKLKERMQELFDSSAELDERIAREVALCAERADISEEIARLFSHLEQFRETIKAKSGPSGRKLEFIVQEIGREINTIGSKASDTAISRLVVEAKSELEKIREQIQNVE